MTLPLKHFARTSLTSRPFILRFPRNFASTTSSDPPARSETSSKNPLDSIEKSSNSIDKFFPLSYTNSSQLLRRVRELTADIKDPKEAASVFARLFNEITGYDRIDHLKKEVSNQAENFVRARQALREAKTNYDSKITSRIDTQREINELLQRKHNWTNEDVNRFTQLYRNDHANEQDEQDAKLHFKNCENEVDTAYTQLTRSIMDRYHEEQLWSDKIRAASTYGTIALMALNLLLFMAVQTIFEPWKRKRLAGNFEDLLVKTVEDGKERLEPVIKAFEQQTEKIEALSQGQEALLAATGIYMDSKARDSSEIFGDSGLEPKEQDQEQEQASDELLVNENEKGTMLSMKTGNTDDTFNPAFEKSLLSDKITLTKGDLLLYSAESAAVGSVLTAVVAYFLWRG
ncbi:uncharacterized protein VTP21DRAFT_5062 [Calcarisporiella thermophila]|uniref:uncharacterized protein n=1 Tax=Calcarisporiella thermophila TaxID=911321 RepID=UPI003742639F